MIAASIPYPQVFDTDGLPLENGKVYFGVANLDPRTNPVTVYWDYAGTIDASQPVRTLGGYLARSGAPALLYVGGAHSVAVYDESDTLVWYAPESGQYNTEQRITSDLASTSSASKGAGMVGYSSSRSYGSGTVGGELKTIGNRLNALSITARDLGCDPTGETDCLSLLQGAIDDGYTIDLGYGIYAISGELVLKDGTGLIGRRPHWKRRTGYDYNAEQHTVIKYTGVGGTNTCVVRLSDQPVGVKGSDFTTPDTDDLIDVVCHDIHIDGGGASVEWGWYIYRAGNHFGSMKNLTAERCKLAGGLMLGMFAVDFGSVAGYSNRGCGWIIGQDVFAWGSEFQCFAIRGQVYAANNGTDETFVERTANDSDGCGVICFAGRGSEITIGSESNFGRACLLGSHIAGGPVVYRITYVEGNGAGPRIEYRPAYSGMQVINSFVYPRLGNLPSEDIWITARDNSGTITDDAGPVNESEWLVLSNLIGSSGGASFAIDSNTSKFKVRDCAGGISYLDKLPCPEGVFGQGQFLGDSTISSVDYVIGRDRVDVFLGDATDTTFTLSGQPTSATAMQVYKQLVLQTPGSAYTVSGNTLTMASAPAAGAILVARYSDMKVTRTAAGVYLVSFGQDLLDARYDVKADILFASGAHFAVVAAKSVSNFEIRTYADGSPTTPVDSGKPITFVVSRVIQ